MKWTPEKVDKLKELWGKGSTASQIASIIGGITRNAVIRAITRVGKIFKFKKLPICPPIKIAINKYQ